MVHAVPLGSDFQEGWHVIDDAQTGAYGIIAIHSTAPGPAIGGCRFWNYDRPAELAADAMRLAAGKSYKNAIADLPFGGGKAVLQRPSTDFDREVIFRVFADTIDALDGQYITAEDVGSTVADMRLVRQRTRYVAGLDAQPGRAGGDPSIWTALGVFEAMKTASDMYLGASMGSLTIAVQGIGSVGLRLCRLLKNAGARLVIADIDVARATRLALDLGATAVAAEDIFSVPADVFAPCALGGVLNKQTIPRLAAKLVCGGANNQLADECDGTGLLERGIFYAPDYVVNAGGIISVAAEYLGEATEQVRERVSTIGPRLRHVFEQAEREHSAPNLVADTLARQRVGARRLKAAA